MFLFLIILLPSALVYSLINFDDKAVIPVVLTGVLSSVLFCALKAFFSFMYRVAAAEFLSNYAYILFGQTLAPVAVVYMLFFFLSKDDVSFRIKSYFPLMCSFYSIYMPFHIIAGSGSSYSAFELFLKPVLYLMMLVSSSLCVRFVFRSFGTRDIKPKIIWILVLCVSLLLPAAIETLWFIGFPVWIWLVLWMVYVFFAACGYINAGKDDLFMKNIKIFLPDFKKFR
ncbi:MAG: hypothetical protein M0P01_01510 [Treponema sp.]|nr:hypothetical protein [Treponema sp.]